MPVSGERPHHELRQPVGAKVPDSRPLKIKSGWPGPEDRARIHLVVKELGGEARSQQPFFKPAGR